MGLVLRAIEKSYGSVVANAGIDLEVPSGHVLGLLGENGAGKSTLVKVLSGFVTADGGSVELDGRRLDLASPSDGLAAGIGVLHQDPLVFPAQSVLDNLLVGAPGRGRRLDRSAAAGDLAELAERFGFDLPADALVRDLGVGEQQQLEIVRLLWLGCSVLILDEPTTAISADQRAQLFHTLTTLAADGMSIILVSHKLEEVAQICDSVAVLREGHLTGTRDLPCPESAIVELMFGAADLAPSERSSEVIERAPGIILDALVARDAALEIAPLALTVGRGEVVGMAGLEGSGQRAVLGACAGSIPIRSGRLRLGAVDLGRHDQAERRVRGIHHLPADRLGAGLVAGLTLAEHVALAEPTGGTIDRAAATRRAEEIIDTYNVKGTPESVPESLSGGNQQRFLLGLLPPEVAVLLAEHPTRGLDVASAEWVWTQLLGRADRGTSILFASSDLDELVRFSDRILVFFEGRVTAELMAAEATTERLGRLIGGREEAA